MTTTDTPVNDPVLAMQEMMKKIDCLRAIYDEETDALLKADTMTFLKIQEKKIEAATDYQSGMSQMMKRKDAIRNFSPALRQELQKKQQEFSEIAQKNLKALERMRHSVHRLNERIMKAARSAVIAKNTVSYSATGALDGQKRPVSAGINESA